MAKMVILTPVACGQLVTNMVNMGVYQKHSENLVNWSKLELIWTIGWCFMALFRFCIFSGQTVTKKMPELQISFSTE